MVDTPKIDASGSAGGLIAASLLNKLLEKDILTLDEAQEVLLRAQVLPPARRASFLRG